MRTEILCKRDHDKKSKYSIDDFFWYVVSKPRPVAPTDKVMLTHNGG